MQPNFENKFLQELWQFQEDKAKAKQWDDRQLLWMVLTFLLPVQDEPLGRKAVIQAVLEDRLFPEYDGEEVVRTDRGWQTKHGEIQYL